MGRGIVFKGKVLCDECYREQVDFEIHAGREKEIPPQRVVSAKTCDRCHTELEVEEEL